MTDDPTSVPADELAVLHCMASRIRAAETTDPHDVERALEVGFAAMIGMEAELSRRLRGPAPPQDASPAVTVNELQRRIAALRDALMELRTLSGPPGESRVGYGFVLPDSHHHQPHAHRR
ncbi:MAG: hypothetical protein WAU75_24735 [Solirubrobacteraceae bacterium]